VPKLWNRMRLHSESHIVFGVEGGIG
jgi:hypothetical protein